jgi:hypothetical protein
MMITTRIQGIPCQVEMTDGHYQTPDHTTWASDWDYHGGWFDVKFEVYDRKGNRAKWLENKMSESDIERINGELLW